MGVYLSELIDKQIEKIKDEQVRYVCYLLREYAEIEAGTWDEIIKKKSNKAIQPTQKARG